MSAQTAPGSSDPTVRPGDALAPVMLLEGGAPDPVALATWHLALASSTSDEIPNDLFALWLYPASGGVVLLGPEALAQDHVKVPLPSPQLLQDELYQLEEILRRAKYLSAIAVPIRQQTRDVGVMLLGSFMHGAFGPSQAVALYRLSGRLAPTMAELADAMPSVASHAMLEPVMTADQLPEHLARAACEAVSGPDLVRRVSGILYALLPHDRLEILVPGGSEHAWLPLSGNAPHRRWSRSGGATEPYAAIVARFGSAATLVVEDLAELEGESEWAVGGASPSLAARSLLGARLQVAGELAGYLLLGSVARDAYRPDDDAIMELTALLVASRVSPLRAADPAAARPAPAAARDLPLARAADILASTAHLGVGLAAFAAELSQVLPHDGISLHLRWTDDVVIALDPAAPRPFADLPAIAMEQFAGAAVLRGDREWLAHEVDGVEELLVPLRVAGRSMGVMGVRGREFESARSAAAIARQFADVLAPHLELLRRGAALGPGSRAAAGDKTAVFAKEAGG